MRLGIIGLGLRAGYVAGYFKQHRPELEVVGYVDPNPCGLPKLTESFPEPPACATVEELLATKLDLLMVSSPNHMHLEHIRAGLEAGVRIFAEKPIVISAAQTFELARLLKDHGTDRVLVGLVLRYSLHMRDLRAAQADGLIGDVVSMEGNEHIAPYHGAFFMRDWRRRSEYSGGFMLEKCCHDLDVYSMIAQSRPVRVASFGGRNAWVKHHAPTDANAEVYQRKKSFWEAAANPFDSDGDTVDNQVAILEYANGARLAFHTNTNTPDEHRRFCVIGTKGMAEGDFVRGALKVTAAASGEVVREHDYSGENIAGGAHYGADGLMAKDVMDHLGSAASSLPVSVVDCMAAGLVAMAIDAARTSGKVIDLSADWEKLDGYGL